MNTIRCKERTTCRICGSAQLLPVIDLGRQYVASAFISGDVPEFLADPLPLELVRCGSPTGCGLVQLRHTVAPEVLYHDYGYRSGTNEIMLRNLRDIAERVERAVGLSAGDLVVDIGCNDGTLLESYSVAGLDRLGVDASDNVAAAARSKGLDVVHDFFSSSAVESARPGRKARAVTSIAMFYDLEDPNQFVADVAAILADDGVWVIELSYLPLMLARNSFDTVCHEHLEYYALKPIEWMLAQHGLHVVHVELNDMNGGSFRLFVARRDVSVAQADLATVEKARKAEALLELDSEAPYRRFREGSARVRRDLKALLQTVMDERKIVYAYGASTKGNTILQYCGLDGSTIAKAADRNPDKWGRRTLGTNIPIVSEEQARQERPDCFLVLPWHFLDGFVQREREFLDRGGKFIVPLPETRILGVADL